MKCTRETQLFISFLGLAIISFGFLVEAGEAAAPPPNIVSFQKLDAPSVTAGPLGWSLDAAGGKIIAGAPDYNGGDAFIYDEVTRHQLFRLHPSDLGADDRLGTAAAISNNYALVGALQGQAAYAFNVQTGQQLRKFVHPPGTPGYNGFAFSGAVALNGNTAIVGDPGDDSRGSTDAGAVFMFDIPTGNYFNTIYSPDSYTSGQAFGASVDANSSYMVVGAPGGNGTSFNSGVAYVYTPSGSYLRTLLPNGFSDTFGHEVKISGHLALVSDTGSNSTAAAYLFDLDTGEQLRKFVSPSSDAHDYFGDAIDFDGQRVLIGDWEAPYNGHYYNGSAYLFDAATGFLLGTLLPNELHSGGSEFGYGVAMDGSILIVSAVGSGNGNVYLTTDPEPATASLIVVSATLVGCVFCQNRRSDRGARLVQGHLPLG